MASREIHGPIEEDDRYKGCHHNWRPFYSEDIHIYDRCIHCGKMVWKKLYSTIQLQINAVPQTLGHHVMDEPTGPIPWQKTKNRI